MSNESDSIREIARLIREGYIGSKAANFTDEDAFWRNIAKRVYHAAVEFAKYDLAARQPAPVVGEAELAEIIYRNRKSGTIYGHLPDGSVGKYPWEDVNRDRWVRTPDCVAETRDAASEIAGRLAAQAVQVPDGTLTMAVRWGGDHNMKQWTAKIERRIPGSIDNGLKTYFGYHPTEPMQALSAALEKAKGGS